MHTITMQARVGCDGILRLETPVDFTDCDLEVTVTFKHPASQSVTERVVSARMNTPARADEALDRELRDYLEETHRHSIYEL